MHDLKKEELNLLQYMHIFLKMCVMLGDFGFLLLECFAYAPNAVSILVWNVQLAINASLIRYFKHS